MRRIDYSSAESSLYDQRFISRYQSKIEKRGRHQCWPWLGTPDTCSIGYGRISRAGKLLYAHRVGWELANAVPIPAGQVIRHSCDNPICCNPNHLVPGRQADNVADMNGRGRGRPHLTKDKVLLIDGLARYNPEHWTHARLSARFEVSETAIRRLLSGATWSKLTGRKTHKRNKPADHGHINSEAPRVSP